MALACKLEGKASWIAGVLREQDLEDKARTNFRVRAHRALKMLDGSIEDGRGDAFRALFTALNLAADVFRLIIDDGGRSRAVRSAETTFTESLRAHRANILDELSLVQFPALIETWSAPPRRAGKPRKSDGRVVTLEDKIQALGKVLAPSKLACDPGRLKRHFHAYSKKIPSLI